MNIHSITGTIRRFLLDAMPRLAVHTPISNGELTVPYVLLGCVADDELIPGNKTWECSLEISLHSHAHDEAESTMREQFSTLCSLLNKKATRDAVNSLAPDFILYSMQLTAVEEPQTLESDFIQTATFRVVVQF